MASRDGTAAGWGWRAEEGRRGEDEKEESLQYRDHTVQFSKSSKRKEILRILSSKRKERKKNIIIFLLKQKEQNEWKEWMKVMAGQSFLQSVVNQRQSSSPSSLRVQNQDREEKSCKKRVRGRHS